MSILTLKVNTAISSKGVSLGTPHHPVGYLQVVLLPEFLIIIYIEREMLLGIGSDPKKS
jgi:hypothetical protein